MHTKQNGGMNGMNQAQRRLFLLRALLQERQEYDDIQIPAGEQEQKDLLRALCNVRPPRPVDSDVLAVQDAYLQEELARKGVTSLTDLTPVQEGIYLWKGDITTLRCGAIVNAANSGMTGCYYPLHRCIDNCIHTYAGMQLRLDCARMMEQQGHEEAVGTAKLTPAYNLPCRYVLHTVGPMIRGRVTREDETLLASCYRSCLELADKNGIDSVAFCCISTGEFHFPNERAAEIAVATVQDYRTQKHSKIEVIFNVFKDMDEALYRGLLTR
jgi:O-acetyl-ADP-ribose deacetylase (regulator of RNase III)